MKTIKNSKEITTLEVDDVVVFGNLEYVVNTDCYNNSIHYYLYCSESVYRYNGIIFEILNLKKRDFIEQLGIDANCNFDFPETKSLEALTAIVSALFKEYERQNELPKTWEEFCEKYPIKAEETYITIDSEVCDLKNHITALNSNLRYHNSDKNICTSKQEAEAFLALMQLRQLRKAYVKDWIPTWTDNSAKFCITVDADIIRVHDIYFCQKSLSFPTKELATQFLTNFKDLLEIAKPLL